jgi:arginyl-tRNA synthetase
MASIATVDPGPMSELPTDPRAHPAAPLPSAQTAPLEGLRRAVLEASEQLTREKAAGRGTITLEHPRRPEFGDYATNAALLLAPRLGAPPREIAERLGAALQERLGAELERFEVAGPGFLNLFLADSWLTGALAQVLVAGERFGAGGAARPERVLVEFVSANPTGPMHVGHARNAAYGDSLARMLELHGHLVEREFYVNDQGSQVRKFGESIQALARGEEPPQDGYKGAYMAPLAGRIEDAANIDPVAAGRAAVTEMVEHMRSSLAAFRVGDFGEWFRESTLHEGEPSPVEHSLAILAEHGHTYTSEGALWLRTTAFGDDKDRVLVRSNGEHTYFASDIAYHQDKRERGFARQIDVWGADHHGYVLRMKAAYAALGGDPEELELLIMQLVHLLRSGERAQMSKRSGEFVTLEELVAEIGVDAARWYLLARSHDTTVDLDLDLAREQSKENPVYYVQYAHARIASMLVKAGGERVRAACAAVVAAGGAVVGVPGGAAAVDAPHSARVGESGGAASGAPDAAGIAALHPAERALVEQLLAFPGELAEAVERRAPHRIAAYVLELAQGFTAFYSDCRVLGAEPERVESLRLGLCVASMRTIASCLSLLGVDAPQQM